MTDCIHGLEARCFDCRTPLRTPYRYRGESRYWTRSQMASKVTDGLVHNPEWTPPPGTPIEHDWGIERREYWNQAHQVWMESTQQERGAQIPERGTDIPSQWQLGGGEVYDDGRPVVASGAGKTPWITEGYEVESTPPGGPSPSRRRYIIDLLGAVTEYQRFTGREWADSDDIEAWLSSSIHPTQV